MKKFHNILFRSTLAAISLTGMTVTASAKDVTLTFVSYGGNLQRSAVAAFQEPYTAATGVEFENDTPPDVAKLRDG
jgi:spermidine/putrescine-binding protein